MIENSPKLVIGISVTLFTCLAIGIPFFIFGCDDVLRPNCLNWYKSDTNVIYLYTRSNLCRGPCIRWRQSCTGTGAEQQCTTYCAEYSYYPCYTGYARLSFKYMHSEKTGTCDVIGQTDNASEKEALYITSTYYPLNSVKVMFVSKKYDACATPQSLRAMAITAMVFLCVAGFIIFIILVPAGIVFYKYFQRSKESAEYQSRVVLIDQAQTVTGEGNFVL